MRYSILSVCTLFLLAVMHCSAVTAVDPAPERLTQPVGHPLFCSPHFSPLAMLPDHVLVVNTPADTVDVISRDQRKVVHRVPVGVDPVCISIRPDGKEAWVSNHVSDSVSVIDTDAMSPTFLHVIATIQQFDPQRKSTLFDEPVGIAFADNEKAYVALSSENRIAVVDVKARRVVKHFSIPAQDPRAIVVRDQRLYVVPFESNNQTQLSGGAGHEIDGDLVTFDAWQHSIFNNNVLSLGHVVDIVKHPDVPDRDLFVFDTKTDQLVKTVDTLGTLLYGMTVDSQGNVYLAQTDARNDVNGRSGTKKHGLEELQNRAFLNRITKVHLNDLDAIETSFYDLEPLPPQHPEPSDALATPYAIEVTADDQVLVVTAAGSDKLFTVDAESGKVLGRADVGAVPRGVVIEEDESQVNAWVYNAVDDSVSVVDVADPRSPKVVSQIGLEDPTDREVKLGRAWFNSAMGSTTGTYSCASCHPDGHTDQLLWVLQTPVVSGGDQIMPRSTMPIRGLRDTEPFHWDGIPGDPYGGNNSANVWGEVDPNSDSEDPRSPARHLIDGGLAATMLKHGSQLVNDEGKVGAFTAEQRDQMARFLLAVPYPPAQKRPFTNAVSSTAKAGFELFHIKGHLDEKAKPNVCGDCHRMPFLVSTNTPGTGMDAPTWRGAYDRFLILPQGRLNIIGFNFYRSVAERGIPERDVWQFSWQGQPRFDPVWDMVLEGSTGFSGTFARQATLSEATVSDQTTVELIDAFERGATEQAVVLEVDGVLVEDEVAKPLSLQFVKGSYLSKDASNLRFETQQLIAMAGRGEFIGTLTARHGAKADAYDNPQPALWTDGAIEAQRGHQKFPIVYPGLSAFTIGGRHVNQDARLFVDGRQVQGQVTVTGKDQVEVQLESLPDVGLHLLQVQNQNGRFSNDFIFNVVESKRAANELVALRAVADRDIRDAIAQAIEEDNVGQLRQHLGRRQQQGRINEHRPLSGSTPLSHAALHGRTEIAKLLLRRGAKVNGPNRDGNTALHVAAFLGREDIVKLLIEKGGSIETKNRQGETPIDVVSSEWTEELSGFYESIARATGIEVDLEAIKVARPKIAALLKSEQ